MAKDKWLVMRDEDSKYSDTYNNTNLAFEYFHLILPQFKMVLHDIDLHAQLTKRASHILLYEYVKVSRQESFLYLVFCETLDLNLLMFFRGRGILEYRWPRTSGWLCEMRIQNTQTPTTTPTWRSNIST